MNLINILNLRLDQFLLWVPGAGPSFPTPHLIIGTIGGSDFSQIARFPLALSPEKTDLWVLKPDAISPKLDDNVYHYWFEIVDTSPETRGTMLVTDPLAYTVDYRVTRGVNHSEQPASVIKLRDGKLWPCDLDGADSRRAAIPDQASLPSNNQLVLYELPVSWARGSRDTHGVEFDVGTFADVLALFDKDAHGDRFATTSSVRNGAILTELGINALELLPAADAKAKGEWGYATAHYFAPDADLGSSSDLARLVDKIHSQNTRIFTDVVMAFGHDPYRHIAHQQFHLRPSTEPPDNDDSYQSDTGTRRVPRDGFGGELWRYIQSTTTYHPETGEPHVPVHPSWAFHRAHLARWMSDFAVDGLRLDSVNNVGNYDFLRSYRDRAWDLHHTLHGPSSHSKFLVIAEELSVPTGMIHSGVVDALWNEPWQARARAALLGEPAAASDFEANVRRLVDCRLDDRGFTSGVQAVNYLTSHDIEGWRKERLFNFLASSGVRDVPRRARLAFALLLTSVGVPMIFAGEEFGDAMDSSVDMRRKQTDPVNYERKSDGGWREALFGYVAGLVRFRTGCPALGEDETEFLHVDRGRGGRIMAWRRGGGEFPVVVVVNLSDEDTPGVEYVVPNWPGREKVGWREVSQGREVPPEWVGREPLMRWEAKIYTRWRE
ncbi:1,4-alpha-glucan branching enzyme GlgB [Podospora conica]|nr:1,4-alpha-glucan branching enzyme GlgB [Schizothecium conicum]